MNLKKPLQTFLMLFLMGPVLLNRPLLSAEVRPNIVLVVLDAVRADHIGCYGYPRQTTPNLDRIASEGLIFTTCITAASWTLPSMASFFTGLYPLEHGVSSENFVLRDQTATLAQRLSRAGYSTVGFSSNAWIGRVSGLDRGFDEFTEIWRTLSQARTDDGAEIINELIEEYFDFSYEAGRPFFLFALYFEPHFPYRPRKEFLNRFLPADTDQELLSRVQNWKHPREVGYVISAPGHEVSQEEFEVMRALYDAEIAYVDQRFGELANLLKKRDLYDNTIFVVTSDHGEHFGEHRFMDHKMSLYEEVIRVPLIVRFPRLLPSGQRIDSLVQSVDLMPSLLSWAGIENPQQALLPLKNQTFADASRKSAFTEFARPQIFLEVMNKSFPDSNSERFDRSLKSVRTAQYKLIWASDGNHELYDLSADPGEKINLIHDRSEIRDRLLQDLEDFNSGKIRGY